MERCLSVLEVESNESLLARKNILGNIFDVFVRNLEKFRDKSLVLSNDGPNKVRFHPDFLFFCKHFGISPRACKPRRPQTKGAVERAGYYLKKTGFRWASIKYPHIKSVEELNSAIQEWTRTFSDVDRSFDSMIDKVQKLRTPKELYEYEKLSKKCC